jgi:SAM-dependent methyltransferase
LKFPLNTPSDNPDRFIRECLEDIRAQSGVEVKHLVVDAGSTDGPLELLSELDPPGTMGKTRSRQTRPMKILNLGCGTKVSSHPAVTNIDWSIYLRIKRSRIFQMMVPVFVRGERLTRYQSLGKNILVHNLVKGIPFASDTVDVVYHSHMLEHLDREVAVKFLQEVKRVLRPGGIQRIVVPDLEQLCGTYLKHLATCDSAPDEAPKHEAYIAAIIEQCVRREGYATRQQPPVRRFLENLILGDARARGETHQWMYDSISLEHLLTRLGYQSPRLQHYDTSQIPHWSGYGLDLNESGGELRPGSLYIEATK